MIESALKNGLLFLLALGLSVLVWAIAQVEQNPDRRDVVSGVPVQVRNVPPGLEVSSVDQTTVNLTVSAPENVWDSFDNRTFQAWIDLSGMDAGAYDVSVNVTAEGKGIRLQRVTPLYLNVKLERMKQKIVPVVVSILDDAPTGYSLGAAVVTPTQVMVQGRQSVVDQVTEAVASLRVEGARSDVQRSARPTLRDGRGSELEARDSLTISPDTVTVGVPIFQLQRFKTVALRAVITGTVAAGYRITSIQVEPQTLTLGGDPNVLDAIGYIDTSPVDVSGARADVTRPARFTIPTTTVAADRRSDVFVNVKVEPIPGQEIIRRSVTWTNLNPTLRVLYPLTPTVDIELAGPLADLARLTAADITVTVNLAGSVPGVAERVPVISGVPRTLTIMRVSPERIPILIDVNPTPTPTPTTTSTPTRTPTLLPAPAATPTPTATPTSTPGPTGFIAPSRLRVAT